MLKRLLIATLVIGLAFSFGTSVFADTPKTLIDQQNQSVYHGNPNHPKVQQVTRAEEVSTPVERTDPTQEGVLNGVSGITAPAKPSVPAPFCDNLSYYSGNIDWFWGLPSAFWGNFGQRFTSPAGIACTVQTAWALLYGDAMTGNPDLSVTIYDDNGFGQPGTALETVIIPYASLPTSGIGWVGANFTMPHVFGTFMDDVDYFVVYEPVVDDTLDFIALLSGDFTTNPYDGEGRSGGYRFSAGEWRSFLQQYAEDYDLIIDVDRCCYDLPFSDCNFQAWHENPYYIWATPHPTYGDSEWSTRFSVTGPETLKSVRVQVYDRTGSANAGPNYIAGDDDLYIKVYDDAAGYPGTLLHTEVVSGGTYPFFPAWTDVPMSVPLVFENDFHVSFSTSETFGSGDYEVLMGDDGATGAGGGTVGGAGRTLGSGDPTYAGDCVDPVWYEMTCWWGLDEGFMLEAELCKDQYAVCQWQWWYTAPTNVYKVPDLTYGFNQWAQFFTASGADCRVDDIALYFYRHPADSIYPNMYTSNTVVSVHADNAGEPGAMLWSQVLTPADYAAAGYTGPGFYGFLFMDVFPGVAIGDVKFHVVITGLGSTVDDANWDGIRIVMDNDGGGGLSGGAQFNFGGSWGYGFGSWAADAAMVMDAKICCIPFDEQDCSLLPPDANWANLSKDQTRSGRSPNALGDAWCDLNLVWNYESPTDRTWYTGATIYDDMVACSFGDHYVVFDLMTGTAQYALSALPAIDPTPEEMGTTIRCAPFITPVASLGGQVIMFVSGGTERSILAYDFATGANVWKRAFSTVGLGGLYGNTRFCPFMYFEDLNGDGIDVLVWATDGGTVVAANAATGALYKTPAYAAGWAVNPRDLTTGSAGSNKTGATDGSSMYFGTDPGTTDGDIYSVDASTGVINWQLSSSGGLQAAALWTAFGGIDSPAPAFEQFRSGISYEAGRLYFVSYLAQGEFPSEGAFYRVNAGDGSLVGASLARPGTFLYGTPIIDINRIYFPGVSRWLSPPLEQLVAYDKNTGAVSWRAPASPAGITPGNRADGALTCEPAGGADLLLLFSDDGFFRVVNSLDGSEIYHRRVHSPGGGSNDMGMAVAFALDSNGDPWVVASDFYGNLMAMQKQTALGPRPRLEILSYRPQVPIEFGANPAYVQSLGQLLTNTGCADLTVSNLIVDENPPADESIIPTFSAQVVNPEVAYRAATLADELTNDSFKSIKNATLQSVNDEIALGRNRDREVAPTNKAAAAPPAWFVGITTDFGLPAVLSPGDTATILVTADQTQITRGPLPIYITVVSDDPDFFINPASFGTDPIIAATIVGGCLLDTTTLAFGAGAANTQLVPNCGRIGTGDWTPHAIEVDGETNFVYQGTFIYAVSKRRIAINTNDWGGGGETDSWISWQPDPNYCDDQCKANISAAALGMYTSDGGLTYAPIDGHIVCKSGVDSVQNFDDGGGGWDWSLYTTAPFDNDSTMGLYVNSRVAGADDGTPLTTNMTIEIFQFTERNGRDLPGWKMGAHIDCDVLVDAGGDFDTCFIDRTISTGWASAWPAATHAFGWIKIPFGCVEGWDSNPLKNVYGLDSDQGLFEDTIKYDSFYHFMSLPPGGANGQTMAAAAQDQQFLTTLKEHDFTPNETIEFAVAMFARGDLTNSHSSAELAEQAYFANKWAGFGRGDMNNDNAVNLGDIMYLAYYLADVNNNPGPVPFMHLGDVNADGNIDGLDLDYMMAYYFDCGPCPTGGWVW